MTDIEEIAGVKEEMLKTDNEPETTSGVKDEVLQNEPQTSFITNFVKKLARSELDLTIDYISEKINRGDFQTRMKLEKMAWEIRMLEDDPVPSAEREEAVFGIIDNLNREQLDSFLEQVEYRIEEYHVQDLPDTCALCGECFASTENLIFHIENDHKEESTVLCPKCNKEILRRNIRKHINEVHKHAVQNLDDKCEICDMTFVSSLAMKRHVNKLHGDLKGKRVCPECSAVVTDLSVHMKSHEEKKFKCDKCSKTYRTKFDLKMHDNSVHLKVLETCPHCGRQTANLNKHIYGNHSKEFTCQLCNKRFARKNQLKHHLNAHERGTIIGKVDPDVQKERKRIANQKYLEKRKVRKGLDSELHEHEKNLKRIWARKNREKLILYKKEYYKKKKNQIA